MNRQKQQLSQHISNQKLTIQNLESANINLEEQSNSANREILDLTTRLSKLQAEEEKFREAKRNEQAKNDIYEQKILALELTVQRIDNAHKIELEEMKNKNELSARLNDNSAVQLANQALAKKDAQLRTLENSLKAAEVAVQAAKEERIKTIEAHQSRIKHLQEKYLNDVKKESADLVEMTEKRLLQEKTSEIQSLTAKFEQEIQNLKTSFEQELHNIHRKAAVVAENLELDLETSWQRRVETLQREQINLKVRIPFSYL